MKLILIVALISYIKFTSSELTNNNAKLLPIYSYVSDHPEHGSLNTNKNKQIFRGKRQNDVEILSYESENSDDNYRSFRYELSDGTRREETLQFVDSEKDNQDQIAFVSGTYEYISKEGYLVKTSFTADDKGYVPKVLFGKNVKSVDLAPAGGSAGGYAGGSAGGSQAPTDARVGNYDLLCSLGGGAGVCL